MKSPNFAHVSLERVHCPEADELCPPREPASGCADFHDTSPALGGGIESGAPISLILFQP